MSFNTTSDARVIAARKSLAEQVRGVWEYRALLARMVRKELQVKYRNSVLGFVWSLLNPALYLGVFWIVFQVVLNAGIEHFPIFLLSGLLAWNLFASALASATVSITTNSALISKVYFPREVLPLASVGAALVHFFLQGGVLLVALGALSHTPSLTHSLAIVPALVTLVVVGAGAGLVLAAANVYLRDVEHLVELALLAWFWLTPIVYPYGLVAGKLSGSSYDGIQWLNPMIPVVLTFQRGIYNVVANDTAQVSERPGGAAAGPVLQILPADMDAMWYVTHLGPLAAIGIVLFVFGLWLFGRLEGNFAEAL